MKLRVRIDGLKFVYHIYRFKRNNVILPQNPTVARMSSPPADFGKSRNLVQKIKLGLCVLMYGEWNYMLFQISIKLHTKPDI